MQQGAEVAEPQPAPQRARSRALAQRFPRLVLFLGIVGPGLIAASAGNDAGGIATYSAAGARFGYQLLWTLPAILIPLIIVQEMAARLGSVTGMGFSDLVRERFGVRMTAFIVVALLIANFSVLFSEFVGIGAAADLLGVSHWIAVPFTAAMLWLLVVFGSYKFVERAFLTMALVFLAYPVAALLGDPDWGAIGDGVLTPTVPGSTAGIQMLIAIIGTTITPYLQLFLQSTVAEKAVRAEDYIYERIDVILGSTFAMFIALTIMVATAATLFEQGVAIDTAEQAAQALEPVAGPLAETLFAVGLLGACLLAAPVLALTTSYGVSEALGVEKGVSQDFRDAPVFMGLFTGMIALGAAIALIPLPFTDALLIIQILNAFILPVVLLSLLRLTNDRELMGTRTNSPAFNVIGVVMVVIVIVLSLMTAFITLAGAFA